jgi:hypothetical protein
MYQDNSDEAVMFVDELFNKPAELQCGAFSYQKSRLPA